MNRNEKNPQIIMGLDFGLKRIGVAIGQTVTKTATPIGILTVKNKTPPWDQIKALIQTWKVEALVVGIPYNMDGSEQLLTQITYQFIQELKTRFELPTYIEDERLTTVEAKRYYYTLNHKQKKKSVDDIAAAVILKEWLNQQEWSI